MDAPPLLGAPGGGPGRSRASIDNGYTPSEWILVRRFIAEARHQIRTEGRAAPDRLEELFEHIAENLCSPFALEPTRMALGLPRDYAARFSRITGTGPKKYITHHRCMLARRILQHVDALIADVAMTIGIEDHSSFTRCYRRVIGHAPSEEKKIDPIQVLFPDPRLAENLGEILIGSRSLLNSDRFWESLCRRMTVEEIKLYILSHVKDIGLAHFNLLLEKSKYVGRTDSFRGEQLAHAAMASLKLLEYWSGEELFHEKVLGYIALANTSRRQFDEVGATMHLDKAEAYLAHVSVEKSGLSCQVKFAKAQIFGGKVRLRNP